MLDTRMKIHVCISTYVMRERILNIFARRTVYICTMNSSFAINFKFNLFIIMIIWKTKYYFDTEEETQAHFRVNDRVTEPEIVMVQMEA